MVCTTKAVAMLEEDIVKKEAKEAMIKDSNGLLTREGEYWKSVLRAFTTTEMMLLLLAATIRQAGKITLR